MRSPEVAIELVCWANKPTRLWPGSSMQMAQCWRQSTKAPSGNSYLLLSLINQSYTQYVLGFHHAICLGIDNR